MLFNNRFMAVVLFLITACTPIRCMQTRQTMQPADVIRAYLEIAFNMEDPEQKNALMSYTTGSLESALGAATKETIVEAYIAPQYKLNEFAINNTKKINDDQFEILVNITYTKKASFQNTDDQRITIRAQNKLLAQKKLGVWYIDDVEPKETDFIFPVALGSQVYP